MDTMTVGAEVEGAQRLGPGASAASAEVARLRAALRDGPGRRMAGDVARGLGVSKADAWQAATYAGQLAALGGDEDDGGGSTGN